MIMYDSSNNETYKCNVLYTNHSHFQLLPGTFGGIPQTLLLSFTSWVLLLLLFAFLRKRAWDYGRLALVQKNEQRWMMLFYGDGSHTNNDKDGTSVDSTDDLHHDKGLCSWLKAMITLKDDQIRRRNGSDAVQYLSFQRHIIFFVTIVCIICLIVVLPINMQGQLEADGDFGRTTLSNLEPESQLIWIHIALSCLIECLAFFILKHFLNNVYYGDEEQVYCRTLMVSKIPKQECEVNNLLRHFREVYPNCVVEDIDIAYDVKRLTELYYKRQATSQARLYCELHYKEKNKVLLMTPRRCGRICICIPYCPKVDALDFYTSEEIVLSEEVEREKSNSLLKPVGIAFVTFNHDAMAYSVFKDHHKTHVCFSSASCNNTHSNLHHWVVNFAPLPEDIFWEHLSPSTKLWYFKAAIINLALFLLFIFLTTPTVVLNYLDYADIIVWKKLNDRSPILSDFLSTLLLLVISVLLPVIMRFSDQFMSYWTRSARNHSIMMKTYVFLLFMVVILPLLQLTSVKALLVWSSQGDTYRWKCVFMSGNGAFFVNYVITASFIGSALELMRFPDLLIYLYHMCTSRSVAEQAGLRQAVLWEFEFGVQYAWYLLIFSVTIIHCLVVPMIAPFGLLCLIMKHFIDRYNIYFVYMPSKINRNILATAINFVIVAFIVMQICMFFFLFVRNGWTNMSITAICLFIFTVMFFIGQVSFHGFQIISPITFKILSRKWSGTSQQECDQQVSSASQHLTAKKRYIPNVLVNNRLNEELLIHFQDRRYGSNEESVPTSPDEDDSSIIIRSEMPSCQTYQRF